MMTLVSSRFQSIVSMVVVAMLSMSAIVVEAQEKSPEDSAEKFAGTWNAIAEVEGAKRDYTWTLEKGKDGWQGSITNVAENETVQLEAVEIKGDELKFECTPPNQGVPEGARVVVKAELDGENLNGTWAVVVNGDEAAGGKMTAEKAKGLAGTWKSAAVLPDGTTLQSDLILTGTNGALAGKLSSEDGEIKLNEAKLDGKILELKFDYEAEGESRPIVVSATWASKNLIEGEWVMKGPGGEDLADGEWSATRGPEMIVLFDGKSLDQFRGYKKEEIGAGWKVEDEVLYFDGTKKSGDIITKQEFENFELEFEWKVSPGGNSGVMYRVSLGDSAPYLTGPEYQVLDDDKHKDGETPSKSAGSLYALYTPENKKVNAVGQWNTSKIVLEGNKVEHWLNGTKVVEAEIGSDDWNAKVEASKFKTWEKFAKNKKGHLCFQDHGNKVWYRAIKVKVLD